MLFYLCYVKVFKQNLKGVNALLILSAGLNFKIKSKHL